MKTLFTEAERQALEEAGWSVRLVGGTMPEPKEFSGREAVINVTAAKGHTRAARALISKAIKKALKIRKWGTPPHHVHYEPKRGNEDPRYTLHVTDQEMERVSAEIEKMAKAAGWPHAPVDIYHD